HADHPVLPPRAGGRRRTDGARARAADARHAGRPRCRRAHSHAVRPPGGGAPVTPILEVADVGKTFAIPTVHRDTLRAHVLDLFRPRRTRALRVLDGVSFAIEPGE